jgi:hypothetical protein
MSAFRTSKRRMHDRGSERTFARITFKAYSQRLESLCKFKTKNLHRRERSKNNLFVLAAGYLQWHAVLCLIVAHANDNSLGTAVGSFDDVIVHVWRDGVRTGITGNPEAWLARRTSVAKNFSAGAGLKGRPFLNRFYPRSADRRAGRTFKRGRFALRQRGASEYDEPEESYSDADHKPIFSAFRGPIRYNIGEPSTRQRPECRIIPSTKPAGTSAMRNPTDRSRHGSDIWNRGD